ncbi:Cytosine/adenosine deaminase [Elusimicrobium minutum Pei191]|uniref:Cytosine/adenosine deaminase n=1 Tax=Elusimicrobium minutum (strain Pei191) TaxID=445932 RepID=B2KAX7_ELUMP|nr:nucleoside deaminase [Elusimicrobium minutum]ACC97673.1 Cytosine/adenosine deaminase [Elusimicrobium minutum Pei191]
MKTNEEHKLHIKFLRAAVKMAEKGVKAGKGGPFGAVIVKDGKMVAKGYNRVTSSNDPSLHAEVDAIRKACKKLGSFELTGCIIYSSCEPCPMCLGAIYWARPKALYFAADKHTAAKYGFDDKFIYEQIALPYEQRSIRTHIINLENKEDPFNLWNKQENKIEY